MRYFIFATLIALTLAGCGGSSQSVPTSPVGVVGNGTPGDAVISNITIEAADFAPYDAGLEGLEVRIQRYANGAADLWLANTTNTVLFPTMFNTGTYVRLGITWTDGRQTTMHLPNPIPANFSTNASLPAETLIAPGDPLSVGPTGQFSG